MNIVLVWVDRYGSDWVGIYANGVKVYEGHPPQFDEALLTLGIEHEDRTIPAADLYQPGRRGMSEKLDEKLPVRS